MKSLERAIEKHYALKRKWLDGGKVSDEKYENELDIFQEDCNYDSVEAELDTDILIIREYHNEIQKFKELRKALENYQITLSYISFD